MEVKWTKFGSLLNPQAQIVSVTVTVATAALPQVGCDLQQVGGKCRHACSSFLAEAVAAGQGRRMLWRASELQASTI